MHPKMVTFVAAKPGCKALGFNVKRSLVEIGISPIKCACAKGFRVGPHNCHMVISQRTFTVPIPCWMGIHFFGITLQLRGPSRLFLCRLCPCLSTFDQPLCRCLHQPPPFLHCVVMAFVHPCLEFTGDVVKLRQDRPQIATHRKNCDTQNRWGTQNQHPRAKKSRHRSATAAAPKCKKVATSFCPILKLRTPVAWVCGEKG